MSQYDYKPEYERNLPHIQPPGATLFVTIRLAGSIPKEVLAQLKDEAEERERIIRQTAVSTQQYPYIYEEQKRQFGRWDEVLDRAEHGPHWLGQPEIAAIVVNSLHFLEGDVYDLDVFCVMNNHVHVVLTPLEKENGSYHAL